METFQTLCSLMEVQKQIQKLVHNQSLAWIQIIQMLHLYELQCKIPAPLRNEDSIRCVFIGILKAARRSYDLFVSVSVLGLLTYTPCLA